jgi:hypothetical protein
MPNNTNRRNQPPAGKGKTQPRRTSLDRKLDTRSEVVQAQRHHPELNLEEVDVERSRGDSGTVRTTRKAGR